jgi:hypothetical protein
MSTSSKTDQVIQLLEEGKLRPEEIAAVLAVSLGTVRAIKANLTRGWYKNKELSPATLKKYREAQRKAHEACQTAKRFTRRFLAKAGYKCMDLDTKRGYEYKGVVDLIAVKRDKKDPDLLTVILFQVKGGKRPVVTQLELDRLRKAVSAIDIRWNYATKSGSPLKVWESLPGRNGPARRGAPGRTGAKANLARAPISRQVKRAQTFL